jgi:hypothetical protein
MQKATIFFIGATIMVISITGFLLGYKFYLKSGDFEKEGSEMAEIEQKTDSETQKSEMAQIEQKTDSEIKEDYFENIEKIENDTPIILENNTSPFATISQEKLEKAGFLKPKFDLTLFKGILFNSIDIKEYRDDEHLTYKIFENNEEAGIINELTFPTEEISSEVYASIREKIKNEKNFKINETNQYGDASFFANSAVEKNFVFLVVKIGKRLYTLQYPAKNHNKMKNLINLIQHG